MKEGRSTSPRADPPLWNRPFIASIMSYISAHLLPTTSQYQNKSVSLTPFYRQGKLKMGNQEPNAGVHGRSLKAVAPTYTSPISALCFLSFLLDSWKNINGSFMQNQVEFLFIKPAGNTSLIPLPGVPLLVNTESQLLSPNLHTPVVPSADFSLASISTLSASLN